jgi:hypothetical protein
MYYGERGAGERPYIADGKVYLIGCGGVEFEVPEASSPGRSESRGLAADHDGFLQSTDPRVDLLSLQVSIWRRSGDVCRPLEGLPLSNTKRH